jgi:hypothetical protein
MPGSQPTKSLGARAKCTITPNPKYATQPGIAARQHDRRGSLSSVAASSPAAASAMRHGVMSPMQQAHDTATMMQDLLVRLVRVEAEVEQLKDEKRRMEDEMTLEKKEGMRRDKEMEELRKQSEMAEEKERSVWVKEVIEAVVHEVERNKLKNGVKEAMETMKAERRDMKRAVAEVKNRLEEDRRREPRKEEMGVKMVVEDMRKMTMTVDRDVTTDKCNIRPDRHRLWWPSSGYRP